MTAHSTIPPSARVLDACALLGVRVAYTGTTEHRSPDHPRRRLARIAEQWAKELTAPVATDPDARATRARAWTQHGPTAAGGSVAFLSGPSGSGKSTVLRMLAARLELTTPRSRVALVDVTGLADRSLPDVFSGPLERAMYWLSRVGLAEASLLARRPGELSEGQRWRLALGVAMADAGPRGWVLADEFGSLLDRLTAKAVASSIGKCARITGRRLVAATAHDDLAGALAPERALRLTIDHAQAGERE